jgi:hypothetical protein
MARYAAGLLALAVITAACEGAALPSPSPRPTAAPVPAPSREPASLPELHWERLIVDGLRAEGIQVTLVGGSKFAGELGPQLPARVFIVRAGAGGEGADVLFLDRPMGEISVCSTRPDATRSYWTYEVSVGDRVVSRGEGQHIRFSVNDLYFVHAIGARMDEAIRKVLVTSTARCAKAGDPGPPVPGFTAGRCTTGPLSRSARDGTFLFRTNVVYERSEVVLVERQGAHVGDRLFATLSRLDAAGSIGLPDFAAVSIAPGATVFRVGVYKPTGRGCWRLDLRDPSTSDVVASYVVEVRE